MSLYRDHILTEAVSSKKHAEKKARYDVMTQLNSQFYSSFYADVIAPERLHKFIIGRKGENIRRIAQECSKVQFKFLKDQSKIQVVGPTEDVRRAAAALQNNVMDLANSIIYADISAPEWMHKFIIGKKGENIKRITENCQKVHFEFFKDQDKVQVQGPEEEVKLAVSALQDNVNNLAHNLINAPEWIHKFIIGRKGEHIRKIRQACPKVHIKFLKDQDKIYVEGPTEEVKKAVAAFHDNVKDLRSSFDFAELDIERRYHKRIIGKAGANIRRIRNETGVVIIIPPVEDKNSIIRIEGDPNGVERARQRIMEMVSSMIRKETQTKADFPSETSNSEFTNETDEISILLGKGPNESDLLPFECNVCDKKFSTKRGMEQHKKHRKYPLPFECNVCDKRFSTKRGMEQHKKHHKHFYQHECDVCGKRLSTKMKIGRQKIFRCYECVVCDEEYSVKRDLWQRPRLHRDFRRYECEFCDMGYSTKRNMCQHLRLHKGKNSEYFFRRYECDICDECCQTNTEL